MNNFSWEQAVQWLRQQPDQEALVKACYFDDPLFQAAERFADSEEWQATKKYFPHLSGEQALDLGAGRGISSFALARDGFQVTALEPDPSALVGAKAIRGLASKSQFPIKVIQEFGERIPCESQSFDLVYSRQVLHHAEDLDRLCAEVWRVLKSGGVFVATREHVISRHEDLEIFLNQHPLHHLYSNENAYLLRDYRAVLKTAGFKIVKMIGSEESVINHFPVSLREQEVRFSKILGRFVGSYLSNRCFNNKALKRVLVHFMGKALTIYSKSPGRLYSFVCVKQK